MSAKVLKHSISPSGVSIMSMELEFPRFILAEFNTHRMFSRNTASSRAIPIETMIKLCEENPVIPVYWGEKNPGMSAIKEVDNISEFKDLWLESLRSQIEYVKRLNDKKLHKQLVNRLIESWSWSKTVVTSTEWNNFFWLRNHKDAQPEFKFLAEEIYKEYSNSTPTALKYDEWHLPYVDSARNEYGALEYYDSFGNIIPLDDAKIISAACCAQVSYRKLDDSLEKCKSIYDKLINSYPPHCSPVEHQATPINLGNLNSMREESAITHMTRDGMLWSANLRGWVQFRKTIPNESNSQY